MKNCQPPDILYHYTTREGLLGIIQKREIWAANIRYLNDSSEFTAAVEVAKTVLDTFPYDERKLNKESVIKGFYSWLDSLKYQAESYVCSFSEDGDLLSQWRSYTKAGNGYAIGFDTAALRQLAKEQSFFLEQCRYDEPAQKELIKSCFQAGIECLCATSEVEGNPTASAENIFAEKCLLPFLCSAPLVKNRAFAEEREWRLVAPFHGSKQSELFFRSGKSMLVPYHPFSLGEKGKELPIAKVIIGPSPHGPLDSQAVLKLLTSNGAKANSCGWSSIPFRDW